MRKTSRRCIGLIFALSCHVVGQQTAATYSTSVRFHDVVLDHNQITIQLIGLSHVAELLFAAKVGDTKSRIGVAQLTPGAQCVLCLQSAEDWPTAALRLAPGMVTISGLDAASKKLFVYLSLQQPTLVTVNSGGTRLFSGLVSWSIAIRDGVMLSEGTKGATHALTQALAPRGQSAPIQKMANGRYLVDKTVMRSHIQSFQLPRHPGGAVPGPACCSRASALLVVDIDKTGTPAIISRRGPQAFADVAAAAVQGWRFSPFVIEGSPAEVRTFIWLIFENDGTVHAPQLEQ